jgi:hypothetical protein
MGEAQATANLAGITRDLRRVFQNASEMWGDSGMSAALHSLAVIPAGRKPKGLCGHRNPLPA